MKSEHKHQFFHCPVNLQVYGHMSLLSFNVMARFILQMYHPSLIMDSQRLKNILGARNLEDLCCVYIFQVKYLYHKTVIMIIANWLMFVCKHDSCALHMIGSESVSDFQLRIPHYSDCFYNLFMTSISWHQQERKWIQHPKMSIARIFANYNCN